MNMSEFYLCKAWLASSPPPVLDGNGECGSLAHYAFIIALVGSAFLIFLYLWKKGKLDMDEEPKLRMMKDEKETDKKLKDNKEDRYGGS
jgi:hypothetical protein